MQEKVFVDTDVIISSLISATGAANLLLNHIDDFQLHISDVSKAEIEKVILRLNLSVEKFTLLTNTRLIIRSVSLTNLGVFAQYTSDINDSHIVLGAKDSEARFLVTYNMKHYKTDRIKQNLGIIVLTPAELLQYWRSVV